MTILRTLTLAACAALLAAAATARAEDMNNDADTQDMIFIDQCLQRAQKEKIPESRIDDFIDRCLNELYDQKERERDAGATPDGGDPGNGSLPPDQNGGAARDDAN
jgi:hypothetical protein